jgi:hypothetical protein
VEAWKCFERLAEGLSLPSLVFGWNIRHKSGFGDFGKGYVPEARIKKLSVVICVSRVR